MVLNLSFYPLICLAVSLIVLLFYFSSTLDLSELGHSCKLSCELSARVKPTLSDVRVALIDMGMYMCIFCLNFILGLNFIRPANPQNAENLPLSNNVLEIGVPNFEINKL